MSRVSFEMKMDSRAALFVIGFVVAFAGCTRSPVIPVSGSVSFPERDMPEVCRLTFVPTSTDKGIKLRPNGAEMDDEGVYHMTEFKGVEGLMPGTYAIRVSYFDLKKNGNPDVDGDWKEHTFEAGEVVVEAGSRSVEHDIEVR